MAQLYNQIVFMLLVFELAVFFILILPLPFTWRRSMFKFISESLLIAKLQFGLKILFIFVGVLFVDSLQHMMKVHAEGRDRPKGDIRVETDWRSRKFLSERNLYLTGSTLVLSLILSRTYSLILDLIKVQEDLAILKKNQSSRGELANESNYKKQLADLQNDYNSLSQKYESVAGTKTDKKSD